MALNVDHLIRILATLERSINALESVKTRNNEPDSEIEYDMYRNSAVKSFELALEIAAKLLRKKISAWMASNKAAWNLTFKDLFRQAARHDLLTTNETERWMRYRDNRNSTAHDYGEHFAEETLKLLPEFLRDARHLAEILRDD